MARLRSFVSSYYIFVVIGVIVCILGLGYVFVISPQLAQLQSDGLDRKETRQQTLVSLQAELAQLRQAKVQFDQITAEDIRLLEHVLPTERDVPQLMVDIPRFAENLGLRLGGIDFTESAFASPTGTPTNIRRLNIATTVSGITSYDRLKTFLEAVQENVRILDLTSVSYSPTNDSYALVLITYFTSSTP